MQNDTRWAHLTMDTPKILIPFRQAAIEDHASVESQLGYGGRAHKDGYQKRNGRAYQAKRDSSALLLRRHTTSHGRLCLLCRDVEELRTHCLEGHVTSLEDKLPHGRPI